MIEVIEQRLIRTWSEVIPFSLRAEDSRTSHLAAFHKQYYT